MMPALHGAQPGRGRFRPAPVREFRSPMRVLDLPSLLALAVVQAPIALGLLLARDLLRKLVPRYSNAAARRSRSAIQLIASRSER
jgi:hypothetical protein